jgi:hypothetical protein
MPRAKMLGSIDIFIHDSEHSYENMMFEYMTAWDHLKEGGILLSDDTNLNKAFSDFSAKESWLKVHQIIRPRFWDT